MIRITLLTLLVAFLSVYAWKDWFRTACWLVLLMAIFQHPDMPKAVGGIPGLNHWNFLFLNVVLAWMFQRGRQGLQWEMPSRLNWLLFFYLLVIFVSVVRYLLDHSGVDLLVMTFGGDKVSAVSSVNDYLINCIKWVIPGFIIFDGCRTRKQYNYALITLFVMLLLLALQVVKAMKLGALFMGGDELQRKALKVISSNVGYHRVNISMIMSGAFWGFFCLKEFLNKKQFFYIIVPGCSLIFLAMAVTGGRTGYGTWALLGVFFCLFKWRRYLLLAPAVLFIVLTLMPSAIERLSQGLEEQPNDFQNTELSFDEEQVDMHSVTSGRVVAWPLVWESIKRAPWLGYGREAMKNTGITQQIMELHGQGESFPHPHNAYLQWLQDNGIIGSIPVVLFYLLILKYSWSLFRDPRQAIFVVTGGISLAMLLALLVASIGSQTFYPREGAVALWVAMCLMLRVYIERDKRARKQASELVS